VTLLLWGNSVDGAEDSADSDTFVLRLLDVLAHCGMLVHGRDKVTHGSSPIVGLVVLNAVKFVVDRLMHQPDEVLRVFGIELPDTLTD